MKIRYSARWWTVAILLACFSGCQMHRMPGGLLPSFAEARHDRAIAEHAKKSGFPSPSDVGLASDNDP